MEQAEFLECRRFSDICHVCAYFLVLSLALDFAVMSAIESDIRITLVAGVVSGLGIAIITVGTYLIARLFGKR
jgi:hypothetical protein